MANRVRRTADALLGQVLGSALDALPGVPGQTVHYGVICDGGLLIDGSSTVLPGPFEALITYEEGDRVSFVLRDQKPLILGNSGGVQNSMGWAGLESTDETNAENLATFEELQAQKNNRLETSLEAFETFFPEEEPGERVVAGELVVGPEAGYHVRMDQAGLQFLSKLVGEPDPLEVLRINTPGIDSEGTVFGLADPNSLENLVASINVAGQAGFTGLNVANLTEVEDVIISGETLQNVIPRYAPKIIASTTFANADWGVSWSGKRFIGGTAGWKRVLEFEWENLDSQAHRVWLPSLSMTVRIETDGNTGAAWGWTTDGTAPSANTPGSNRTYVTSRAPYGIAATPEKFVEVPAGATLKVRLDIWNGGGQWVFTAENTASIWDLGPASLGEEGEAIPSDLSTTSGEASSSAGATKKTYVKTYNAAWVKSWPVNSFYNGKAVQGTYSGTTYRGYFGFPNMTTDLTGATISKVEAYVYFSHWWLNAGGVATLQGHKTAGTTAPGTQPTLYGTVYNSPNIPRAAGRWVTVNGWAAGLKSGDIRGIALVGSGQNAYGTATSAKLRITYKK